MTLFDIIKKYGFQVFSSSDSSCACGTMQLGDIAIRIHCHKSSCNSCDYAGVHYGIGQNCDKDEARKIAQEICKQVKVAYRCDCNVTEELPCPR